MAPRFSVILPTLDRPDYLAEAVDSVLSQTVDDFELIVVDDASREPPSLPTDSRIRLLRREHTGGPAIARNLGLDNATGKFIAFLDDDDWWTQQRLAFATLGLKQAPISVCWQTRENGLAEPRMFSGSLADRILDGPTPALGATAIERELIPRFDERFPAGSDADWWLRTARVGEVSTVPEIGCVIRQRSGPPDPGLNLRGHMEGNLLLLDLHADYFATHSEAAHRCWLLLWQAAKGLGENKLARKAAMQAFRLRPTPKTAARVLVSL